MVEGGPAQASYPQGTTELRDSSYARRRRRESLADLGSTPSASTKKKNARRGQTHRAGTTQRFKGVNQSVPKGQYIRKTKTVEERFMAKVDISGDGGCWNWIGSLNPQGYGQFCVVRTRPLGAHRVAMMLFREHPITPGRALQIDHLCRNKRCVNPDHLEVVTARENILRALPFRRCAGPRRTETHCKRGHEFTEENTYVYRGHRACRACHALAETVRRRRIGVPSRDTDRTHCRHGHQLTADNLVMKRCGVNGKAYPVCRSCYLASKRAYNARRVGAR